MLFGLLLNHYFFQNQQKIPVNQPIKLGVIEADQIEIAIAKLNNDEEATVDDIRVKACIKGKRQSLTNIGLLKNELLMLGELM